MLGAIIGDIVGSRFEWNNIKTKEFDFLTYKCFATDDSIMSLAVAQAVIDCNGDCDKLCSTAIKCMQEIGRPYPNCGFGGMFYQWIYSENPKPYGSYGNGAAMRVSACGFAANSLDEAIVLSKAVTEVTHNHPEGIKGAEATTVAIYLARDGKSIPEIRDYIDKHYYPMNFTLDGIRDTYIFNETCQDTVPQAIMAFLESTDFEDAIRNAISIGGDSNTLAAITGGIAEAYYGIPAEIRKHALTFLDERLLSILNSFESKYGVIVEKSFDDVTTRPIIYTSVNNSDATGRAAAMTEAVTITDKADHSLDVESETTTANQLYSHLYEACNILRGPIDQDDYKSYVIPILFFKRISDVYDEENIANALQYGDDIEFYPEEELHAFVIPQGCHWVDVRNTNEDIGKAITDAMMGIERANPDTLAGLFSSFDDANWTDKTKLDDERLKNLIEHMSALPVGNDNYSADVMGDAYEYLIKKFADMSKKNAGEFYTPRSVVKLMVQLLKPKAGETVYDPTCGSAGMLISCIAHLKNQGKEWRNLHVYGQEINQLTSAIGKMNLFLHGVSHFDIVNDDTLKRPAFIENGQLKQFDIVLANPPYSIKQWDRGAFENDKYGRNFLGTPPQGRADYAFLQHILASLKPNTGRCAILFPHGVLFRGEEAEMRKKLVESDLVECVIGIGKNLFYNSPMEACIMICRKTKPIDRRGKVLLINARNEVTRKNSESYLEDDHIAKIASVYHDFSVIEGFSNIASIEEIQSHESKLSIALYVRSAGEQSTVSVDDALEQWVEAAEKTRIEYNELLTLIEAGDNNA